MLKEKYLKLLKVDLRLFDEGSPAPEAGSGSTEGGMGGDNSLGDAGQVQGEPVVIYGKQDLEEVETVIDNPEQKDTDNGPDTNEPEGDTVDPAAKFEEMIKGDFKEIFDNRVQQIINARFKETKQLQETVSKVDPVLNLLMEKYGTKDTDSLLEMLENEAYEDLAYKEDMTPEQYRRMKQLERENEQFKMRMNTEETDREIQERVANWYKEGDSLKEIYPTFDLKESSKNPEFLKMLQAGVSVKAAYEAAFFEQILNQKLTSVTQKAQSNTIESIKAKKQRIPENGVKKNPGVIVKSSTKDLTAADRAEIARRAAMGEKISF